MGAPPNINRATLEGFLAHDVPILGTPTYGDGESPGPATGLAQKSWAEFLPRLQVTWLVLSDHYDLEIRRPGC